MKKWYMESKEGMDKVFHFIAANPGRVKKPLDANEAFRSDEIPPDSHVFFWVFKLFELGELLKNVDGAYYATPGVRR